MSSYRYVVNARKSATGDGGYYYIYDRKLMSECGLPVNERNLSATVPLRWHYQGTIHGPEAFLCGDRAHRWLERCVAWWGRNPNVNAEHPQDVDWQKVSAHLQEAARVNTYR